jgi:hypothetical protein
VIIYLTITYAVTYECAVKECSEMQQIYPAQDKDQPRPLLNTVMTLRVPSVVGHVLSIRLIQKTVKWSQLFIRQEESFCNY